MYEKLRACIDTLFEDAPQSVQTVELKEEMLQNLIDKYDELVHSGKSQEAAYNIAVAGIGDVTELINNLGDSKPGSAPAQTASAGRETRSALLISIAVALYILSPVPIIALANCGLELLGVVLLFVFVAAGTFLIIYNSIRNKGYAKKDSTVVEEFKEWNGRNNERAKLQKAISSCLWSITLVVYFIISFTTGSWGISWIIFLISAAIESIIKAIFDLRRQ